MAVKSTAADEEVDREDIRSAVAAAFDTVDAKAADGDSKGVKPAEIPAKAEEADVASESETTEKPAAEVAEEPAETTEVKEPETPSAIARWSKPDQEMYAKLPKEAQDFLVRRHKDMDADYTKKREADAGVRREYDQISSIFAPYKQQMQAQGLTVPALVNAWATVEQKLMKGEGDQVVAEIVKNYKIEPAKVLKALGIEGDQKAAEPPQFEPQVDAALQAKFNALLAPFQQQIQSVTQTLTAQQQAAQQAHERQVANNVQAFIDAKDAAGNLLHPHFEAVSPLMVQMANVARQNGQQPDLEQIYQQAVWATPQTREQLLSAQKADQEAKARDAARAKAVAAKKASVQVTGSPTGQTSKPPGNPDKPLRATLDEIYDSVTAA